jgi:hypothetical protein
MNVSFTYLDVSCMYSDVSRSCTCRIHARYEGYMQDTSGYVLYRKTPPICIGTPPSPVRPPLGRAGLLRAGGGEDHQERAPTQVLRAALDRLPVDSVSAVNAGSMLGRVPRLVSAAF